MPFQWGSKRFGATKSGVTAVNGSYHNKNHYEPAVTPQVFQTEKYGYCITLLALLLPSYDYGSYGSYLQLFQANLR